MFGGLFGWRKSSPRKHAGGRRSTSALARVAQVFRRLRFEPLEVRSLLSVNNPSLPSSDEVAYDPGVPPPQGDWLIAADGEPVAQVSGVYPASAGVARTQPIVENSREISTITQLVVSFTQNLATTGVGSVTSTGNWQLKRNELDISSQISGITFGFNGTTNRYEAVVSLSSPLTGGLYSLTSHSSIQDTFGSALDGDANGTAGGEFTRHFTVAQPIAVGGETLVKPWAFDIPQPFDQRVAVCQMPKA